MSVNAEIKGDKLVLTIDVSGKPYVSKTAIEKATKKGLDPAKLEPQAIATSGGFVRVGNFKYSVNVNIA